jgi:hypothetical protein
MKQPRQNALRGRCWIYLQSCPGRRTDRDYPTSSRIRNSVTEKTMTTSKGSPPLLRRIKQKLSSFRQAKPGQRFQQQHARGSGKPKSMLIDAAFITIGVVLILAGTLLSLVPGVPGIVLALPGLVLLAIRFRHFAAFLDKAELIGRRIIQRILSFKKNKR